ncbi:hypothetical protein Hanom_Chr12g01129671 [Helianthus anomalus]
MSNKHKNIYKSTFQKGWQETIIHKPLCIIYVSITIIVRYLSTISLKRTIEVPDCHLPFPLLSSLSSSGGENASESDKDATSSSSSSSFFGIILSSSPPKYVTSSFKSKVNTGFFCWSFPLSIGKKYLSPLLFPTSVFPISKTLFCPLKSLFCFLLKFPSSAIRPLTSRHVFI